MSKIEWTEITTNVIGGCANASPGCDACYARSMSHRLNASRQALYVSTTRNDGNGVEWTGAINTDLGPLIRLRSARKPKRVFMNSMSDWCHPGVPTKFIGRMWDEMACQSREQGHVFMCLTKRPGRIVKVLGPEGIGWYAKEGSVPNPEPGIWLGTSIESDDYCWRADRLREAPAAIRFLSLEPLLGPLPSLDLTGIHWVIVGGESGARGRAMHPQWVRDIRDRCVEAGVSFFFKQWGEWGEIPWNDYGLADVVVTPDGERIGAVNSYAGNTPPGSVMMHRFGKKGAGRDLDGRTWDEVPPPWRYVDGRGWLPPETQAEAA